MKRREFSGVFIIVNTEITVPEELHPTLTASAARCDSESVPYSEVLAALSYALDMTEGQPRGHAARTCVIGMRLADELDLPLEEKAALYNALLLKDSGCSSNAAEMSRLFGSDDRTVKASMKRADWQSRIDTAFHAAFLVGQGLGLQAKARYLVQLLERKNVTGDLIRIRCGRGAEIARRLGFTHATADAIHSLDEHWNGKGFPIGLSGERIPLTARIMLLAQSVESTHHAVGLGPALRMAWHRSGKWFDPKLVRIVRSWKNDSGWWALLRTPDPIAAAVSLEPAVTARRMDGCGLDNVARAFADIIDAKSPYTYRHSTGVAEHARGIAESLGYAGRDLREIERAALLHDIGKLGVSSRILDKPASLTAEDRVEIERHPLHTWEILDRVSAFRGFSRMAASHHERLDGSGYPWGLSADQMDMPSRILGVADVYEALTADRPYRAGMSRGKALDIMNRDAGTKLCATAIAALAGMAGESRHQMAS